MTSASKDDADRLAAYAEHLLDRAKESVNISGAPDSFTSKMAAKDRPKGWMSSKDAHAKFTSGEEKKLQKLIANYLSLHDIYFECDRMDKRTRGKVGRPDFRICYRGRFVAVECKTEVCQPTTAQFLEFARIRRSGGLVLLVRCLDDMQGILREIDAEIRVIQDALKRDGWEEKK